MKNENLSPEQAVREEMEQTVETVMEQAKGPEPAEEVRAETPPRTEPVQPEPSRQEGRVPLTHRTAVKVLAFALCILMSFLAAGCVVAAIVMVEEEIYTTSEWAYRRALFENIAENDTLNLLHRLEDGTGEGGAEAMDYLAERNIASVEITFSSGPRRSWGYDGGMEQGETYTVTWYRYYRDGEYRYSQHTDYGGFTPMLTKTIDVTIGLAEHLTARDNYYLADRLVSLAYALRYWVYAIGIAAAIAAVLWFAFLMRASGRKKGLPDPQPGWGTAVPFDLLTLAAVLAAEVLVQNLAVGAAYFHSVWKQAAVLGAVGLALAVIVLGWCMSAALRWKLGGWWKNTVVFHALRLCWFLLKKLWAGLRVLLRGAGRGLRSVGRGIAALVRGIPLVRKTVLLYLAVTAAETLALAAALSVWYWAGFALVWALEKLALFPAVIFIALMLRRLRQGGEALAAGDLGYQVDTTRMLWDFKQHGEDLNRIGEGITAAVEQRLRSERLKTELITNVSHDIKTPLTSIINYADLIGKEPCENGKITEYAEVLHRQSDRLRRLIDDLVEASKASTGNLEVLLAPCEAGVLLTQAAGEYEQRLKERDLELVTRQPEKAVKILGDGRRLWRVFDNLMNNILKYAQSGTRVYLSLEERDGEAVITFRNTSREPLALSAEDFLERFVQGDASRSAGGSGLGLSIAKSLTELQKGTLELTVDGDLFKVILRFPVIK